MHSVETSFYDVIDYGASRISNMDTYLGLDALQI